MRSLRSHCEAVKKIVRCKTKTNRERLEKEYGVRYSVLLELDYFDPVRMTVIDPMHNLFLGTAKRMISLWKDHKILLPEHFDKIQLQMEKVQCPSDVGKLPQKFASSLVLLMQINSKTGQYFFLFLHLQAVCQLII